MRSVRVAQTFDATVAEAEAGWYDTTRWERWIDGLERVLEVSGAWPAAGARVTWESGPAGRGRVTEIVVAHEPLAGQTLEVEDPSIRGRQSVAFRPAGTDTRVEVALTLEYELKRRNLLSPLVDALFIRRAMAVSLATTVTHFGLELEAARAARRAPGADHHD